MRIRTLPLFIVGLLFTGSIGLGAPPVTIAQPGSPASGSAEPPHVLRSVVRRFPQFKAEDSMNLAKVAEALKLVQADMIYRTKVYLDEHTYQPVPLTDSYGSKAYTKQKCSDKGLEHFGGYVTEQGGLGTVFLNLGPCRTLVEKQTPGVIWNTVGHQVVFMTFDGHRFLAFNGSVEPGNGPEERWVPLQHHQMLYPWHLRSLGKLGYADATATFTAMDAASKRWSACANALWNRADKEYQANGRSCASYTAKQARARQITAKYKNLVERQCARPRAQFETALVTYLKARETQRRAMFAEAKARLAR